jgi:chitin disaccharide deacetylase
MLKNILICADDYSQNNAICDGILNLLSQKKINATSCLVNSESWNETHQALNQFKNHALIGLHLNLTLGSPLSQTWKKYYGNSFPGLGQVIRRCYSSTYQKDAFVAEINAQVDAFTHALGINPDFIDGHQHIHQLPGLRDVLMASHTQQHWTGFFRNTSNGVSDYLSLASFPKRQLIALLGGHDFKKSLTQEKKASNTSFAGIYNFKHAANYRHYFKKFLKLSQPGGLIMCHPGMPSTDHRDPLYRSRHHEFHYFMSDDYVQDLAANQTELATQENLILS